MILVDSGTTHTLEYISRFGFVDRIELYDHASRVIYTEDVSLTGYTSGKIIHNFEYTFKPNELFTYKAYYKNSKDEYILATKLLLKSYEKEFRKNLFKHITKAKTTFKVIYKN